MQSFYLAQWSYSIISRMDTAVVVGKNLGDLNVIETLLETKGYVLYILIFLTKGKIIVRVNGKLTWFCVSLLKFFKICYTLNKASICQ